MSEIIARRSFTPLYIYLDIAFLIVLCFLLLRSKRYMAVIVGAVMGIVYMLVDYGIFHLATGSRSISEGYSLFWVLLWMSISYGFTNFAWIWLWFDQDKHLLEWSFTIVAWWFVCPHLSSILAGEQELITIQRTTSAYHGWMAAIWFVSYLALVIYNMRQKDKKQKINIIKLFVIGIVVQFSWEMALLLGGIRSVGFTAERKFLTLAVNSLLETNLGMPASFVLYILITSRITSQLKVRKPALSFAERLEEYHDNVKPARK